MKYHIPVGQTPLFDIGTDEPTAARDTGTKGRTDNSGGPGTRHATDGFFAHSGTGGGPLGR